MDIRCAVIPLFLALTTTVAVASPRIKDVTGAKIRANYGATLYLSDEAASRVDADSNFRDLIIGGAQASWFPGVFRVEKGEVRYERNTDLTWTLTKRGNVAGAGKKGKGWVAYDIAWNGASADGFMPGSTRLSKGERLWEVRIPVGELAAGPGIAPQDQALIALTRKLVKGKQSARLRLVACMMDSKAFTCVIAGEKKGK